MHILLDHRQICRSDTFSVRIKAYFEQCCVIVSKNLLMHFYTKWDVTYNLLLDANWLHAYIQASIIVTLPTIVHSAHTCVQLLI